uniref:Uncharacterized protein n=1 Tax=Panagrolaimus sp. ES5 TaxID=591445 RepID=A0AC34F9A4_9BILA
MKNKNVYCLISIIIGLVNVKCQNQSRQCGIPENIDKLPDFAQDEIKAVWKDYKPGNKCEKELLITDDILAVLDMFDKEITQASTTSASSTHTTVFETLLSSTPTTPLSTTREFATASPQSISSTDAIKDDTFNSFMPTPEIPTSDNSHKDYDYFDTKTTKNQNIYTKTTKITSTDNDSSERKKIPLYEMENILPFLEGANKRTILAFHDLLNDPDIPSEGKRQQEIHLLAVSYLDEDQLRRFNEWSTNRRKRLRAREQQLSHRARDALEELINVDEIQREKVLFRLPRTIRKELRNFALRRKAAA